MNKLPSLVLIYEAGIGRCRTRISSQLKCTIANTIEDQAVGGLAT